MPEEIVTNSAALSSDTYALAGQAGGVWIRSLRFAGRFPDTFYLTFNAANPEPVSADTLGPDDYDDAQVLTLVRMWSGFEPEMITDEQLIELLGLDDHLGTDIPDWMMMDLGVLVASGDVTVDEFVLALQYVLENS